MKYMRSIIYALLLTSCASGTNIAEMKKAEVVASEIHEGMTFEQVSKIIPISTKNESLVCEHGGVWYDLPVNGDYYIQIRFENEKEGKSASSCKVNLPVRIRQVNHNTPIESSPTSK